MPCPFVELSRRPRDKDGNGSGDEVRRARENKSDGGVEVEALCAT